MNDDRNAYWRERLLARVEEIEQMEETNARDQKVVELDQQSVGRLSRMDALQQQALAKETGRRRELERKRIDAALKRLDEDEFGYCVSCGEALPERRLELDPMAAQCTRCAR